jgi:hypothetical protein
VPARHQRPISAAASVRIKQVQVAIPALVHRPIDPPIWRWVRQMVLYAVSRSVGETGVESTEISTVQGSIYMRIKLCPGINLCSRIDGKSRNQTKDLTFLKDSDNILPKW